MIFKRSDWMVDANCRGMDPDWFHPARGEVGKNTSRDLAIRAVCADCPVVVPCREMGLEDYTLRGYWGGLSERERRIERQRRDALRARSERASAAFQSLRAL